MWDRLPYEEYLFLKGRRFTLKFTKAFVGLIACATLMAGCGTTAHNASSAHHTKHEDPASPPKVLHWGSPPAMTINPKDHYEALVHTTAGNFTISLFAQQDPVAVNNFVFLANQHYYNGNQFFRVVASFVIQTGDPTNTGEGGPGYTWKGEFPIPYPYQSGIVAMAISNTNKNSNGSQFFICTGPQSEQLNQEPLYTEVGRVTHGWSTVEKIAHGQVTTNPMTGEDSKPIHPYSITSISIVTTSSPAS